MVPLPFLTFIGAGWMVKCDCNLPEKLLRVVTYGAALPQLGKLPLEIHVPLIMRPLRPGFFSMHLTSSVLIRFHRPQSHATPPRICIVQTVQAHDQLWPIDRLAKNDDREIDAVDLQVQ